VTPYSHYDRFSAMDAVFLALEDGNAHMHIGSVGIFDADPLAAEGGGVEFDRIVELSEAALQKNAHFQQKLAFVPALDQPVWVDDEKFNLRYHVRHTCLPTPGNERLLKRLAGRIMSEKLDRGKPLWEMWFVDGVEGNRCAVISKIHSSLADGVAGVDLLSAIVNPDPDYRPKPARGRMPRPAPSGGQLLLDEIKRLANIPLSLFRAGAEAVASPGESIAAARNAAVGIGQAARAGLVPASETPLNGPLGPHRRFDWARFDLADVKQVRNQCGGTLNDVVLALVAGAVRRFFIGRGFRVDDLDFRALVPVSIRQKTERRSIASRMTTLLAPLPLDEPDPCRRLERVVEGMRDLKRSKQRQGEKLVAEFADRTFNGLMLQFARFGLNNRAANLVVTNVPGPRGPVYLLGSRMREVYPVVPLGPNQTLGVALFSYDGGLYWGFNADWDVIPDLHDFVEAVQAEFDEICRAAAGPPCAPAEVEKEASQAESVADAARSSG
jgi:WS/DGAT/MGAT family acyltransferase